MERKHIEAGILNDYYGGLLTELQSETVRLYYDQDLSLSEIAEMYGTSRQAVAELLARSEKKLYAYEEKLGLLEKISGVKESLERLLEEEDPSALKAGLKQILQDVKDI